MHKIDEILQRLVQSNTIPLLNPVLYPRSSPTPRPTSGDLSSGLGHGIFYEHQPLQLKYSCVETS